MGAKKGVPYCEKTIALLNRTDTAEDGGTMAKKKTSPHVPEQYRGFALQPTRMALLLLKAPQGSFVSMELLDDVAVENRNGDLHLVQTKDTRVTNPVTDRSSDFWKTFANWTRDVRERRIDPTRTIFELYVSRKVTGNLVAKFHNAKTKQAVAEAFETARNKLWGAAPRFPLREKVAETLKPHLEEVFGPGAAAFQAIIERFQLTCAIESPALDLEREVSSNPLVPPELIPELLVDIHGWLKRLTDPQLETGKAPIIERDNFHLLLRASFSRLMPSGALPDLALTPPRADEILGLMGLTFVQQLEIIKVDNESRLRAIICFFKAGATRSAWAEKGMALVNEDSVKEFEEGLKHVWRNHKEEVFSDPLRTDEQLRGRLLLGKCEQHRCPVEGKGVPEYFLPGCFHALSNEMHIGWHPQFDRLLRPVAA